MLERELQDYLYAHPEVLFPDGRIQEKAREYAIHGRRIDLLFVVDGVRHIVELKAVPLQREHIGQTVEYYGLMKGYLQEANLKMILVSPSIPEFRAKYLEELGIRCVEISSIPENDAAEKPIVKASRASRQREREATERESMIRPDDCFVWEEVTSPSSPRTVALARRFLRETLEPIRNHFLEYEVVPYGVSRHNTPDVDCEYCEPSAYGRKEVTRGSIWWAYRFGTEKDGPPNDVPNISVMAHVGGLDVTLNAELKPSQLVLKDRIGKYPERFNQLLLEHGQLWLKTYLKFEHQPRFYHWILADRLPPGEFDAAKILTLYKTHADRFELDRETWIERVCKLNRQLSPKQISHLNHANRFPNLATRLARWFPETDPFWNAQHEEQLELITEAVKGLKPIIDFFVENTR